jgi:DNA-binding transcriptional LysR family regulator
LGPVSWQLVGPEGRVSTIQVEPRVSAGDFAMLLQATLEGIGLALLPEIDCQPALQAKQLVRVLPDWGIADGMIHLVFPSRRGMLPGVRAVIEFLATTLQATNVSK